MVNSDDAINYSKNCPYGYELPCIYCEEFGKDCPKLFGFNSLYATMPKNIDLGVTK